MNLYSVESLLILFVVAAAFFLLLGPRTRQLAFAACSIGFLSSYLPGPLSWAVLLTFLLSGFGCGLLLRGRPSRLLLGGYLVLLVAAFAILKRYDVIKPIVPRRLLDLPVEIVGLSYMLFRQIHFLVNVMQEQIERPTLWSYLNYQLNPFTLLAGPIQRYQDFQAYWEDPVPLHRDRHDALKAYLRLFLGIIKVVLISEAFRAVYERMLAQLDGGAPAGRPATDRGRLRADALFLHVLSLLEFLGLLRHCDRRCGTARAQAAGELPFAVLGAQHPRLLDALAHHAGPLDPRLPVHSILQGGRRALAVACHSRGGDRLFRGLHAGGDLARLDVELPGLRPPPRRGASAAKLWETAIVRYAGRPGLKRYLKSSVIRGIATVGTFHYACFTLLFFAMDLDHGRHILGTVLGSFMRSYRG